MAAAASLFLLFTLSFISSSSSSSSIDSSPSPSLSPSPSSSSSQMHYFLLHHPILSFFFFFTFSIISLSLLILFKIHKNSHTKHLQNDKPRLNFSSLPHPSVDIAKNNNENDSDRWNGYDDDNEDNNKKKNNGGTDPNNLTHSLLVSFLPSDSPKWKKLFVGDDPESVELGEDAGRVDMGQKQIKKKKKRAKKKRPDLSNEEEEGKKDDEEEVGFVVVTECPFTTSSSTTQRKIKQQYDQLVKSHQSNGLTLAQVGQFVNCLIEARNGLQHKSEVVKRKFTIAKALLSKADRSSIDRQRQQVYKLELEQKRLEEDACVYNWLQQQLKLSPAYKKMLEIAAACKEMKAKSAELTNSEDAEFTDISFEELLEQEKKDSFWQRHGKPKQFSGLRR